ncbi:MAG: lysylphosphatidylglycerol synthase domain-containing protein, partial [Calditrichota bacterium]
VDRFSAEAGSYLSFIILFLLTAGLISVAALLHPWFYKLVSGIFARLTWMGIGEKVQQLLQAFQIYRRARFAVLKGFLLSLSCQLLLVTMNFCLAKSLSLPVDFSYLMLVVPATFAIGLLPSINGLGVRDLGYERLLSQIGISSVGALSLSFLNTLLPLSASIAGGICLLFQRKSAIKAEQSLSSDSAQE